jgi:hypothetical protein
MIYTLPVMVYLAPAGRIAYSGFQDRSKSMHDRAVVTTCADLPFSDNLISRRTGGDFSIHQ